MNKYNARRCFIDGKKFDSQAEAEHYLILKDRQKRGEIYGLECQKRFVIIEPQIVGKKHIRETVYIADFAYRETYNDRLVVEDTKGYKKGVAYQLFVIKRKLMLQNYGIWVREV